MRAADAKRSEEHAELLAEFRAANSERLAADKLRSQQQDERFEQQMDQLTRFVTVAEELTDAIKNHSPVSSDSF